MTKIDLGREKEIARAPRRIGRGHVPIAVCLAIARMALGIFAREEGVADSVPAGCQRAPFDAKRDTLAGTVESTHGRRAAATDVVVEFLRPEAELISRVPGCRDQSALASGDHPGRLIGHRN